jgi:hypothetical protein
MCGNGSWHTYGMRSVLPPGTRCDSVSCIECLALVSSWKVENLDDLNVGVVGYL